jgi:imidazoleglycerol-phosphate dehydratase
MTRFQIQNVKVVNEAKAGVPIHTGIGYLDHMIDQLNSHAQVGVGLQVVLGEDDGDVSDKNRLATQNQADLCRAVGSELGAALNAINAKSPATSRFCCPLDEALVECILSSAAESDNHGQLQEYTLPPYGIYPKDTGRSKIGQLETAAIESFWKALAESSKLCIKFQKIRGDNGHHIVESSFKAFSRALRNYLDPPGLFDASSDNNKASVALARSAKISRSTKETSISVELLLDGKTGTSQVDTGIPVLDEFFLCLAEEAHMTLQIQCKGDLWVDDHHTAEDVSIAVGQCLTQALGTKAGLNRMWLAEEEEVAGGAKVEVTMDLSNRPCLRHNLHESLGRQEYIVDGESSPLSCEMLEHVLDSLVVNGRMTVHIVEKQAGASLKDTVMCTAKAFGKALFACAMVDQRRAGQTASSKGTLSV